MAQGYNQEEDIDFDKTLVTVPKLDVILLLLPYACSLNFHIFQMDVKSDFLNGYINEEVYANQPPSFEKTSKILHVSTTLYSLKQAPMTWYDRLNNFLCQRGF